MHIFRHSASRFFRRTIAPYLVVLTGTVLTLWLICDTQIAGRTGARAYYLAAAVFSLSLIMVFILRRLLGRSAFAERLERAHGQTVEKQREAEHWAETLSKVFEQCPLSIIIVDLHQRIEYVNDTFVEMTGRSPDGAIGDAWSFPDIVGEEVCQKIYASIQAGKVWQGELPGHRRDGSGFLGRIMAAPIREADGRIRRAMVIEEDITELRELMGRLHESEQRFRGAMAVMAEGLAIVSSDGRCHFANPAAQSIFQGLEAGQPWPDLKQLKTRFLNVEGDEIGNPFEDAELLAALCAERELRNEVIGLRSADGTESWLEVSTSPLPTQETAPRLVATFSDITGRRRADENARLALAAIRHSGDGILMTDAEHRIISVNPAFETITGFSADEALGKTPAVLFGEAPDDTALDKARHALDSLGYWQGEVGSRRKNGDSYAVWLGISAVRETGGRPRYYVHLFSDMTERKVAQQRIEFLAHHDPLTELPNRLLLRDRVTQAMARAIRTRSRAALLFLDLDRFKKINDSLGHPVGDALLKSVTERLQACVRESDTISRQGGDEFIVVLSDVRDVEAVTRVADKIHQVMTQPFPIGAHSLMTSFSIGVALFPDDGEDFDTLLKKADTAMYHAKEAGRNSHRFFTEQMNRQVVEHMTLETRLRRALENGEFVLHYQPQIDLRKRNVIGVEALLRWNSPEDGLVLPGKFMSVAEESGLITHIGAWVLHEACRQAKAWQNEGLPPMVMAINLSASQFRRFDLLNTVIEALVLSELDAHCLELELTESILLQDTESMLNIVQRLKALGLKLSVDDFGTGYSSLAYLKRFAVDKLKIDQSFIRDLLTDPDDAAIVRAIIQMAHGLKLRTIAEGVESEELCKLLALFQCDEIQGYWLAPPMPCTEIPTFIRTYAEANWPS